MNAGREELSIIITDDLIPECCHGNKAAEAYLKRVFYIVRQIDDLYDEDHIVNKADIIQGYYFLFGDIGTNKFYLEHQGMLSGVHILAFNAWQDANLWADDADATKRLYAHVIRDYICELFILVAYLTGGSKLMRQVSMKVREVFLKELGW